jgi:HrpA-like RNA helicase
LLGSLKRIQRLRKADDCPLSPLKVVVMSATLDAERFSDFFYKSVGRLVFPVSR